MSDNIPSKLYREILLRLPADSLFRFRSVCKAWRHVIDDPSFVKSHIRNYNYNSDNTLLIRNKTGAPLFLVNLDSLQFTKSDGQLLGKFTGSDGQLLGEFTESDRQLLDEFTESDRPLLGEFTESDFPLFDEFTESDRQLDDEFSDSESEGDHQVLDAMPVKQLIRPGVPRLRDLPTASCNGLILISSDDAKKIWAIWNPLTRECHQLPPAPPTPGVADKFYPLRATGLGFDYAADDFKVVRIDRYWLDDGPTKFRALVYSLKLGCWRRIKDCPYDFWCDRDGLFLNGALHWDLRDMIFVLDVGTEDYRQMPLPPMVVAERRFYSDVRLDAVGGCLTMCYPVYNRDIYCGWVMKDYGGAWTKLFTLDLRRAGGDCMWNPRWLVVYLKRKGQVIFQRDRGFLWYDIVNDDMKQFTIHNHTRITSSQNCPGSLYRLDDGGGVSGNVATATVLKKRKRKRTKKIAKTRLKFCVRDCNTFACSDFNCLSPPSPRPSWYEGEGEE